MRVGGAGPADELAEAVAAAAVEALLAVAAGFEALVALAGVGAAAVAAPPVGADVGVGRALVHVLAVVRHAHLLIPLRADAHEGANEVLAEVLAVVGGRLALV